VRVDERVVDKRIHRRRQPGDQRDHDAREQSLPVGERPVGAGLARGPGAEPDARRRDDEPEPRQGLRAKGADPVGFATGQEKQQLQHHQRQREDETVSGLVCHARNMGRFLKNHRKPALRLIGVFNGQRRAGIPVGATQSDVTAEIVLVLFPLYSLSFSFSPPIPDERERERERERFQR
jgi:hypothetical protein